MSDPGTGANGQRDRTPPRQSVNDAVHGKCLHMLLFLMDVFNAGPRGKDATSDRAINVACLDERERFGGEHKPGTLAVNRTIR